MKIANIVGARPQFIKVATVSRAIAARRGLRETLIHTGQHFDANMSQVFFEELEIPQPDFNLGIGGGTHGQNTGRMLEAIEEVLCSTRPDWVVVYGDTDSTLAGTLAAVKLHIPVAHVESGLRSFNRNMPEEINRVLTDHAANLLFAPTKAAVANLRGEGIPLQQIKQVGDVMYDATSYYRTRARRPQSVGTAESSRFVLCTVHRAENTDSPVRLASIVDLVNRVAERIPVILPLHPRTAAALRRVGGTRLGEAIRVIEPVGFLEMAWLLGHCSLVLTDSGGLQKEAYFHNKPCLTLRDQTEWVELVEAGFNKLLSPTDSFDVTLEVLDQMLSMQIPLHTALYGDGGAAEKILDGLQGR